MTYTLKITTTRDGKAATIEIDGLGTSRTVHVAICGNPKQAQRLGGALLDLIQDDLANTPVR